MASALHAEAEEAYGAAAQAQGDIPAIPVAAGGSGGTTDQSGAAGLGELLRCWGLQRVLRLRQGLGGKEDQASHGAISESTTNTTRISLET